MKNASNGTRCVSVMADRRWTRDEGETEDRCWRIVQGYYAKPMQLTAAAVVRILLFDGGFFNHDEWGEAMRSTRPFSSSKTLTR